MPLIGYTTVKTFSATRYVERERLGERFTEWLEQHQQLEVVDVRVLQSSDPAYHCISILVFLKEQGK